MLDGKKGLIRGIASANSIAYGCARAMRAAGDGASALTGNVAYVDAGYHIFD